MLKKYKLIGSRHGPAAGQPIELQRTAQTRRLLLWDRTESALRIAFVHQRQRSQGRWENEPSEPTRGLKPGETRKFQLSFDETRELRNHLNNLYAIVDQFRMVHGEEDLVVAHPSEIIVTSHNKATFVRSLLRKGYSDELWKALVQNDPDLATRLSYAQIYSDKLAVLKQFRQKLAQSLTEASWQEFFENNTWIFGYGLNYRILKSLATQPRYGGLNVAGKGTQKGDYLQRTEAQIKFTVLVEIKKPNTELLGTEQYRNGAWELSRELTGGVSQMQANCIKWEKEGAQTEENREMLLKQQIFTVQPKGILIIGHTNQLNTVSKRNSFELFRRNMLNPEILTFDEVFERAKFIVEQIAENSSTSD